MTAIVTPGSTLPCEHDHPTEEPSFTDYPST